MDEKMDHGPILKQEVVDFTGWSSRKDAEKILASKGSELLINIIPDWISQNIEPIEQDHGKATFTKKIEKEDGLIDFSDLSDDKKSLEIYLKVVAYNPWPSVYFDIKHLNQNMRVKIIEATWDSQNNKLNIKKVIPAGRKEMDYESFKKGFLQ